MSFPVNILSVEDVAIRSFNSGLNCAESVLTAVNKELKAGAANSVVPRIATGFGGGISRNGDVCGAVTGGVIAISLALGRDKAEQSREPCYGAVDRFYNDFRARFGSCRCRELTNANLKTPEGSTAYKTAVHAEVCVPIAAWAAKTAREIIEEALARADNHRE